MIEDVIHRKLEMLMRITFYNDNGDLAALKLYTTKNKIFSECWGPNGRVGIPLILRTAAL